MNHRQVFLGLATIITLAIAVPALAAWPADPLIPPACTATGATNCGLREMLLLVINVSQVILGLVGSAALVMFIYGGFMWLISAGSAERVERGRKIFEGALIGLALIFSAWLIINFVVAALSGQTPGDDVKLFPKNSGAAPLQIPQQ